MVENNSTLQTSTSSIGLSSEEAERRLLLYGSNEIVPSRLESSLSELKRVLLDPMGLMLLGLSGLYALLGDNTDSIVLLIAFIPITAVDVILEMKSRKALRALRATLKLTAKVLRDDKIIEVAVKDIVVGDVIVFEEGQSLPADGKVLECKLLTVNESALTGESVPVEKSLDSQFYAGTEVLNGQGLGLIEDIGKKTRYGKIASLLEDTESEKSPLQKKVNHLIRQIAKVAIFLSLVLFLLEYSRGKDLFQSIIVALTFGIAAIPEEFPLVFTLYLSLGAWRLSKHGVLVKSLPSVEALGGVDVICTDKTGTLTEGKFQLEDLYSFEGTLTKESLWRFALMACEEKVVDSMELAIVEKGKEYFNLLSGWRLVFDYPFVVKEKYMSHVWRNTNAKTIIVMKGAVEGVLEHCKIDSESRLKLLSLTDTFSSQGKRLLGLAYRDGECSGIRDKDEKDLQFVGLLVFSDPIRKSVKNAIHVCQSNGITIKMLTGDHPLTAHAVAEETGILHSHEYLFTGNQLAKMSKEQRWEAYQKGAIFSRVLPEQKHEMVQALKDLGKVVAMTGDGINDAPALKLADIGISMGLNATDVARSTAQMILLKNNFKGIVEAVFEGRRIFSNLRRSFSYLISFHVPVILLAFIPSLLGWGDLLLPIHIVLLELIVHPVSAYAFENLQGVQISSDRSILPRRRFIEALLSGVLLSLFSLLLFHNYIEETGINAARTVALITVLIGNIAFVIVESWPLVTVRLFITVICLLLLSLVLFWVPFFSQFLHFGKINLHTIFLACVLGIVASIPTFIMRISALKLNQQLNNH